MYTQYRNPLTQTNGIFLSLLAFIFFVMLFCWLQILESVAISNVILITAGNNVSILDKDGLITILLDRFHTVSDENYCFFWILLYLRKEIITFSLECFITNSKYFIKDQNVTLSLNCHRKGKTHLHAGRVVFQLLIHEIFKLREFDDIVIHRVNLVMGKTQQSTIQIYVFSSSKLGIETYAKLDERNQCTFDINFAIFWSINSRNNLQQCRFSGTIAANNSEEISLMDIERNIVQNMLDFITFNTFCPIDYGLF